MAPSVTQKIFAYNPGPPIFGTTQVGDIAISDIDIEYSDNYGGVQWWGGPNEANGYVIAYPIPGCNRQTPIFGLDACLGFKRSEFLTEQSFVELSNAFVGGPPAPFADGNSASTYLTNNGYWNSWVSITPTPTPTFGSTPTPTPTVTNTQTPTNTPTLTPTPSSTPSSVTGYSFNLVVLPYNYPSSGNTIMVDQGTPGIGTTDPNVFATNNNAIYFNAIDTNGVNRTSYFASFTGQSITLTISQTGSTAIYSGSSTAFQSWSSGGDSGFTFGYGVAQPGYSAGTTTLIQSAPTNWVTGQTVTISAVVNGAGTTPTPTATSVTPTPTPTSGASGNFNVTISQVGPDVVWNGSGSFNLAALTSAGSNNIGAGFQANQAIWAIGPNTSVDTYSGTITYPTSFGSPASVPPPSTVGSTFGILPGGSGRMLWVPSGYVSNTVINGTATYANTTISGMGLTSGVYTWSWGTGGNTSTLVMTIS